MPKILVPSYRRCGVVRALGVARQLGIPSGDVYIATQVESDYESYSARYPECHVVYEPRSSCAGNRNTLLRLLSDGERAIMCDDDVCNVFISESTRRKDARLATMDDILEVFSAMEKDGSLLGGTYPSDNQLFIQRAREWSRNAMLTGCFLFCVGGRTPMFNEEMEALEDYEICARIVSSGNSLTRYNRMFTKRTNNRIKDALNGRGEVGGYQEAYLNGAHERAMGILLSEYHPILKRAGSGGRALVLKNV